MRVYAMPFFFASLAIVMFAGCSDVVTTEFGTIAEARSRKAFNRGWLPPVLPESAKSIVERNNLDLNTGAGEFDYDAGERTAYLEKLSRLGASVRSDDNADVAVISTNGSHWELRLPHGSGKARWTIRQQ